MNNLTSLDLGGCTNLETVDAQGNQIASMNVSNCPNLTGLNIFYNQLTANAMGNLIAGLPTLSSEDAGRAYVLVDPNPDDQYTEGNVITAAHISQAKAKHWVLYHYNWSNYSWDSYTGSSSKLGDVNGDNDVDISDVVALVNIILNGSSDYQAEADVNNDGGIDISDVVALVNIILGQ